MKIKEKLADGTVLYNNGMIGTKDLPEFLNGFRNAVMRPVKRKVVAMLGHEQQRPSWRGQLAHVYGQIKQARKLARV